MPRQATRKLQEDFRADDFPAETEEEEAVLKTAEVDDEEDTTDIAPLRKTSSFDFSNPQERHFSLNDAVEQIAPPSEAQPDIIALGESATPGGKLRHTRMGRGMSSQEVADRLFLDKNIIEKLEEDDYDHLPPAAFVQGYIRNYARLLELDPDALVQSFFLQAHPENAGQILPQEKLADAPQLQSQSSSHDRWFKGFTLLLILGAIGMIALWWSSSRMPGQSEQLIGAAEQKPPAADAALQEESSVALPAQAESLSPRMPESPAERTDYQPPDEGAGEGDPANLAEETEEFVVEAPDILPTPPAQTDPEQATPAAAEEISPATSAAMATDARSLHLSFSGECWTEVYDSSGKRLYMGTQLDGGNLALEGEPPFRLVLGRTKMVTLTYQGETVDLSRFRGGIGRFSLPFER